MLKGYVEPDIFYGLWKKMWFPDDLIKVNEYINGQHEEAELSTDADSEYKKMQSMKQMNAYFSSISLKFKLEFKYIFKHLGLPVEPLELQEVEEQMAAYITLQGSGHVCVDPPIDNWCQTNAFGYTGIGWFGSEKLIYEWDDY